MRRHVTCPWIFLLTVVTGCDDRALQKPKLETQVASAAASAPPAPRKPRRRPSDEADLVLGDERRRRIEAALPEARGFLELEPVERDSTSFLVKIDDVAGYDSSKYQSGDLVVVLARYRGKRLAKPGHDVVDLGHWDP